MAKQRITLSTFAGRALAAGAVIACGVCSTVMNGRFGYQLGASEFDGQVYATFSVGLDIAKWFALGLAATAWRSGAKIRAAAGLAVWLVAVAYSGAAAIGFSALNRDATSAERLGEAQRHERALKTYEEATARISEAKTNARWEATSGCTNATAPKSIEFCNTVAGLERTVATAKAQLDQGKPVAADPQAALIARMSGLPQDRVTIALAIAVAIVSEVVSALGLFAVMAPPNKAKDVKPKVTRRRRKPAPRSPPKVAKAENVVPFKRRQPSSSLK